MAQDSEKKPSAGSTSIPDDGDDNLHYYSGGEVKELADTKVNPAIKWVYAITITICVISVWYAGVLKSVAPYQPKEGSSQSLSQIRADLAARDAAAGTVTAIDLDRLPAPEGQTRDQAIKNGQELYQQYCIGCHGPNQDGNGPNAASLNPKPRNLRDAPFMQSMSLERINQSIHRGVPGTAMPHWEDVLNEAQIRDVIFYVWSLTAPKPPADAAAVAAAPAATAPTAPAAAAPSAVSPGATPQNSAAKDVTSSTSTYAPGTPPPAPPAQVPANGPAPSAASPANATAPGANTGAAPRP